MSAEQEKYVVKERLSHYRFIASLDCKSWIAAKRDESVAVRMLRRFYGRVPARFRVQENFR